MPDQPDVISYEDFLKVKMRVAKVVEALPHPNADKLILLKVDLGDERRQLCAGLRGYYEPQALVGKNIILVTNLAPRKMRGEMSEGMLLAATTDGQADVVLLTTDREIPPGSPIS